MICLLYTSSINNFIPKAFSTATVTTGTYTITAAVPGTVNIVLNFIQVKAEKIVPFSIPIDGGIYVFPCAPIILKNIFYNIIIHIDKKDVYKRQASGRTHERTAYCGRRQGGLLHEKLGFRKMPGGGCGFALRRVLHGHPAE